MVSEAAAHSALGVNSRILLTTLSLKCRLGFKCFSMLINVMAKAIWNIGLCQNFCTCELGSRICKTPRLSLITCTGTVQLGPYLASQGFSPASTGDSLVLLQCILLFSMSLAFRGKWEGRACRGQVFGRLNKLYFSQEVNGMDADLGC